MRRILLPILCLVLIGGWATPTQAVTTKRIAVLLINFSGDSRQPWTPAFIDSLYDGPPKSVRDFYEQSSWGQITTTADVFGWFPIAAPVAPCSESDYHNQADAAATAAGVDLASYTNIAYIWPQNNTAGSCRSSGEWPGRRNGIALQTTCTPSACSAWKGLAHEFGHNLGMDHAGSETSELGDGFDIMGCCPSSLLSNVHRLQMGWIPPSQVVTVTNSQSVTVTAAQAQASTVYRVPITGGNFIYLENRAVRTTYENGPGTWTGGMLLIRVASDYTVFQQTPRGPAYPATTLLDGTPGSTFDQPGLPVGQSLTRDNVTITNQAFDGTNNTVQIEVGC